MLPKANREPNYRVMLEQALDYMFRHQISEAVPSNICTLEQFCDLLRAHIELTDDLAAKREDAGISESARLMGDHINYAKWRKQ